MNTQLVARIADEFIYEGSSFTYKNVNYDLFVDQNGNVTSCTCPDHTYRHRACKHMRALSAQINAQKAKARNERIQAQARAIVAQRFAELERERDEARASGGFSILR
jgi:uncharacterized Zn finger protein